MSEAAPENNAGSEDAEAEALLSEAANAPEGSQGEPVEPVESKNPWEDPEAARAEIERLRKENGAARTNAKQKAADEARKELAQQIGKAIGLIADETDEAPDPAQLTEALTTSQAEARQARVELAVFRNAAAAGGDPSALLDSASFLRSLGQVDPTDSEAVTAAIASAVESNPRLAATAVTPQRPQPDPSQGQQGAPTSLDAQIRAAEERGDTREAIRLKARRLNQN